MIEAGKTIGTREDRKSLGEIMQDILGANMSPTLDITPPAQAPMT